MSGHFVVSLDFELHYGVRDHSSVEAYRANLAGVREAIPALLDLFVAFDVRATWATVAMLLAHDRDELLAFAPRTRPRYRDTRLDPYAALHEVGADEHEDPFHFASSLVDRIAATPGQEIGTHTFAHTYALEPDVGLDAWVADLSAARALMAARGLACRSIVFPRNQYAADHVAVLPGLGITAFRGASRGRMNRPSTGAGDHAARRAARLVDAYLPLIDDVATSKRWAGAPVVDVPASRFLRPWSKRLAPLEGWRLERIRRSLTRAARTGGDFHLWWHPHNFGTHLDENLAFLRRVLELFRAERDASGIVSAHMADRADAVLGAS